MTTGYQPDVHMSEYEPEVHVPPSPGETNPVPILVNGEIDIRQIHGAAIVHEEAADYGAYFTIPFTGTEDKRQLLPYDANRARAFITCASSNVPEGQSTTAEGSVTNPGAFGAITFTSSLPAGIYQVTAIVYLSGTVTSADANNMEIVFGGTPEVIAYPGVANSPVTYTSVITLSAAHTIGIQTIGAASGALATYNASIAVTPLGNGTVWVGSEAQCAQVKLGNTAGGGFQLGNGITLPVMHKQPVWIVPDGVHAATVSVAVERWES